MIEVGADSHLEDLDGDYNGDGLGDILQWTGEYGGAWKGRVISLDGPKVLREFDLPGSVRWPVNAWFIAGPEPSIVLLAGETTDDLALLRIGPKDSITRVAYQEDPGGPYRACYLNQETVTDVDGDELEDFILGGRLYSSRDLDVLYAQEIAPRTLENLERIRPLVRAGGPGVRESRLLNNFSSSPTAACTCDFDGDGTV